MLINNLNQKTTIVLEEFIDYINKIDLSSQCRYNRFALADCNGEKFLVKVRISFARADNPDEQDTITNVENII